MCDISTNKKYLTRPSPPRPANEVGCKGKTFIGNDGNLWKSSTTSRGIFRWVKVSGEINGKKPIVKKSVERKAKKSVERKAKKSVERKAKKSVERKAKKSVERKTTGGAYKISFPLKYIHEQGLRPTKSELEAFYKKESFKEVKDILTQYSYPQQVADMVTNISMTKTGVMSFSLPKSLSKTVVENFVNENIRHNSLADGSWEASPGIGLVYVNKNVIGFGPVKVA